MSDLPEKPDDPRDARPEDLIQPGFWFNTSDGQEMTSEEFVALHPDPEVAWFGWKTPPVMEPEEMPDSAPTRTKPRAGLLEYLKAHPTFKEVEINGKYFPNPRIKQEPEEKT